MDGNNIKINIKEEPESIHLGLVDDSVSLFVVPLATFILPRLISWLLLSPFDT